MVGGIAMQLDIPAYEFTNVRWNQVTGDVEVNVSPNYLNGRWTTQRNALEPTAYNGKPHGYANQVSLKFHIFYNNQDWVRSSVNSGYSTGPVGANGDTSSSYTLNGFPGLTYESTCRSEQGYDYQCYPDISTYFKENSGG